MKQANKPTNPHAPVRSVEEERYEGKSPYPDYEQSYMFEETEQDNKIEVRG